MNSILKLKPVPGVFANSVCRVSYFVNKSRTMEWMKNDDSTLLAEFKRGRFLCFINKQPFLYHTNDSVKYSLALIPHNSLLRAADKFGFEFNAENAALIDVAPMQSSTNDTEEEFLPIFAVSIVSQNNSLDKSFETEFSGETLDLRRALFFLNNPTETNLLAKAQSMLRWMRVCKFCSKCAEPLKLKVSKASAHCHKCGTEHRPTISPAAITLLTDNTNEHALLVRQPRLPAGVFTAIAGFAELGEPIEDTVRREVAEEVGVDVDSVQYAGRSQAWPYPNMSLMCGFFATTNGLPTPNVDKSELEDAQWFSRSEVLAAFQRTAENPMMDKASDKTFAYVPPIGVLSHELIKHWLVRPQ